MKLVKSKTIPYTAVDNRKAYFCEVREYFILDNYINSSLPLVGWFKMCSKCSKITGEFDLFEYSKNIFINIPLCYCCFDKLSNTELYNLFHRETKNISFDTKSLNIFYELSNSNSLEFSSSSSDSL